MIRHFHLPDIHQLLGDYYGVISPLDFQISSENKRSLLVPFKLPSLQTVLSHLMTQLFHLSIYLSTHIQAP